MADFSEEIALLDLNRQAVENGRQAVAAAMQDVLKDGAIVSGAQASQLVQELVSSPNFTL